MFYAKQILLFLGSRYTKYNITHWSVNLQFDIGSVAYRTYRVRTNENKKKRCLWDWMALVHEWSIANFKISHHKNVKFVHESFNSSALCFLFCSVMI